MISSKLNRSHRNTLLRTLLIFLTFFSLLFLTIQPAYSEEPVNFPDENLEQEIRDAIDKQSGDIYPSDLEGLTLLIASHSGIDDLTGIEYCVDLQFLALNGNNISNLTPLSNLTNLQKLGLWNNNISDITPLSNLTNLQRLGLCYNNISDITPLSSLTNLQKLELLYNNISDITPLSSLTNLQKLELGGNNISDPDLDVLSNLTNLQELNLWHNNISDISPLSNLTNLQELNLWYNNISDISPLSNLTNLQGLRLPDNNISDISPLSNLDNLQRLGLSNNNISDIQPLVENSGLGSWVKIVLTNNYLDLTESSEDMENIQTLIDRGATVKYEPQKANYSPTAAFSFSPDNPAPNESVTFDASGSSDPDGSIESYSWDFGDGSTGNGSTVTHTYDSSGTYTVKLTVTDNDRATDAVEADITVQKQEQPANFPDEDLEQAIRDAIGKQSGDIYPSDLEGLTSLQASDEGISNLTGLEYCEDLKSLNLWGNNISSISQLSSLSQLEFLKLGGNEIQDITAVSNLKKLRYLELYENNIQDISSLSDLVNLTKLLLHSNEIKSIKPVSNLSNLEELDLYNTGISNISPLENLSTNNLSVLFLGRNNLAKIGVLSKFSNLKELYIAGNNISNIMPLTELNSLEALNLDNNNISDIQPLVDNDGLGSGDEIYLKNNYLDLSEGSEDMENIQTLIDRGATVKYEPQKTKNEPPNKPVELAQFKPGGETEISVGDMTSERTAIFKGKVSDPDGDKVRLQVELRRLEEYGGGFDEDEGGFKNGDLVKSENVSSATAADLIRAHYHWRARAVDEHDAKSDWVEFGNNVSPDRDFTILIQKITEQEVDFSELDKLYKEVVEVLDYTDPFPVFLQGSLQNQDINIVLIASESTVGSYKLVKVTTPEVKNPKNLELYGVFPSAPAACMKTALQRFIVDELKAWVQNSGEKLGQEIILEFSGASSIFTGLEFVGSYVNCVNEGMAVKLGGWEPGEEYLVYLPMNADLKLRPVREMSDCMKYATHPWLLCDGPGPVKGEWTGTITTDRDQMSVPIEEKQGWWAKGFNLFSPGKIKVYDSHGRVTGIVDGEIKENIPRSVYNAENKTVSIFFSQKSYTTEIKGTDKGSYGLTITSVKNRETSNSNATNTPTSKTANDLLTSSNSSSEGTFTATDISTSNNTAHQYTADWNKLSQGKDGVTVKTDEDGDGTYEDEMNVGNAFSGIEAGTNIKREFTNQGISLVFDEVTSRGFTNVNVLKQPDFKTSSGIHLVGDTYKFSTTASYSGNINITLSYDDSYLTSGKEEDLQLFKIDKSGNVKDITTSCDKYNDTVTGTTEGFSYFAVGYRDTESLAKGWNIFSPPGAPLNPNPSVALGDDLDNLNLFYDYGEGGYTSYPTDTTDTQLFWRQGYWMYLSEYRDVDMDVTSPESDLTIQFQEPGWKLIGAPYPVNWSKASFSDPSHFDSDGSGNVRLISWNPYEERYLYHYSDTSYVLDPWRGYWIKVNEASSDEPATINLSETSSSPASVGTKTPLPQSVDRDELDKPPAPPDLADTKDQLELVAFPNPAGNTDEIRFGLNISEDAVDRIKVKVFNSSGTLRWSARSEGSVLTWNCEGTPNGIYLYQGSVKVDGTWRKLGVKKLLVLK